MLNYSRRGALLSGATALVVCAVVAPGIVSAKTAHVAKAKTYKVTIKMVLDPGDHGIRIPGNVTAGKPFGKGRVDGKIAPTSATFVLTFKGGKVYGKGTEAKFSKDGKIVNGKFKFTKGTGKFKGIKGKGTEQVNLGVSPFEATIHATAKL